MPAVVCKMRVSLLSSRFLRRRGSTTDSCTTSPGRSDTESSSLEINPTFIYLLFPTSKLSSRHCESNFRGNVGNGLVTSVEISKRRNNAVNNESYWQRLRSRVDCGCPSLKPKGHSGLPNARRLGITSACNLIRLTGECLAEVMSMVWHK